MDLSGALSRVDKDSASGCWIWTGSMRQDGYGNVYVGQNRNVKAHRFFYEAFVGPVPVGLQVDHQCHNLDSNCLGGNDCPHRRCVNPDHLAPATNRENTCRGRAPEINRALGLAKSHCKHGHLLSGDNVHFTSAGYRVCRACSRASSRKSLGERPTAQRRGPLRKAIRHDGRLSVLECGHIIRRDSGTKPIRLRCAECEQVPPPILRGDAIDLGGYWNPDEVA